MNGWKAAFLALAVVNALILTVTLYYYIRKKILKNLRNYNSDPLISDYDSLESMHNNYSGEECLHGDADSNPSLNSLFSPPIRHSLSTADLRNLRPAADIGETENIRAETRRRLASGTGSE